MRYKDLQINYDNMRHLINGALIISNYFNPSIFNMNIIIKCPSKKREQNVHLT